MADEKTVDKIRKLLAKSRDAGASEAEAAACAERARELMEQHDVTEDSLDAHVDKFGRLVFEAKYMDPWRKNLGTAVGYTYGCVFLWRPQRREFLYCGARTAAQVSHDMFKHLERVVMALAAAHRSAVRGGRAEQLSFERGCGERLAQRLVMMAQRRDQRQGGGTALIIADEFAQVTDWLKEKNPQLREDVPTSKLEGRSAVAGWQAADDVNIGRQLR